MGCGSSSADKKQPAAPAPAPVQPTMIVDPEPAQKPQRKRGPPPGKFQIKLSGDWKDYDKVEDTVLKKAYLVGHPNCKFALRGQKYKYDFVKMEQLNEGTKKTREIRPPRGFKQPEAPVLPTGPMTILTVKAGQAGTTVSIPDPVNTGKTIQVNVPANAKPGQKMAVPLPEKGETVADVQTKQRNHSKAKNIALGTMGFAAVSGAAVGGVILGDHLTGGGLGAVDVAGDVAGAAGEAAEHAAEAVADWAPGAADSIGEAGVDGAGAVGEWAPGALDDAEDWLGDAAEDTGEFIMSLF